MSYSMQQLKQQREKILAIASHYQAENIRVFGSVARNENNANSDIDFLVAFKPNASLFDQAGLIDALSHLLQHNVDVISERAINTHIKPVILQEAQSL